MNWIPVSSSAITAVSYDITTRTLAIRFVNNPRRYDFYNVPKDVFHGLLSAPSKGRYFNDFIRDKYPA